MGYEIILSAVMDGVLSPMTSIVYGLSNNKIGSFFRKLFDNKFGRFVNNLFNNKLDEFLGKTFSDSYESLAMDAWAAAVESGYTHSPGRIVGCAPGENYYYNGLLYECY